MNDAPEPDLRPAQLNAVSTPVVSGVVLLLVVVCSVSAALWRHWTGNPDLSHGLLMPLVFIYLIHEARTRGVQNYTQASAGRHLAGVALGGAALMFGFAGALYASALGWGHALAAAFTGTGLAALLLLAVLSLSDRHIRLIPCNWQACCAASLWVFTVPLPPGAYTRLSGGLQQGISQAVLLCLNLLGIPATRQGNIIELTHGRVGVEEACSGVRSLIACIFAALLISALVLRAPARRVLLVVLAPLLALVMNLLRSLLLTLLANAGIDIGGAWHDATGFGILGLTALLLFWLAHALEAGSKPHERIAQAPGQTRSASQGGKAPLLLSITSCAGLLALGLLLLQLLPRQPKNPILPDLNRAIPISIAGWEQKGSPDLQRFTQVLHTEKLLERSYTQGLGAARVQVTIYAAAWEAGAATPAEISLHTPEVCWPGAGWTQILDEATAPRLGSQGRALRFRSPTGEMHQVVYWLLYDGEPVPHLDPYSPLDLLRLALSYGHRAPAPQVFIRISGNRPHAELLRLAPVREALHALGISDLSSSP